MKKFLFLFFIIIKTSFSQEYKIYGETDYTQQNNYKLQTSLTGEYRLDLYQHPTKKWIFFIEGKIQSDYNIFGKELKNNVFTTLGIDF